MNRRRLCACHCGGADNRRRTGRHTGDPACFHGGHRCVRARVGCMWTGSSSAALIAARFAQGLGAALLVPCSLALVRNAFDNQRVRAGR